MANSVFIWPGLISADGGGQITVPINAIGNETWLTLHLSDHGAVGDFTSAVGSVVNPGDATRNDHTLAFGYNIGPTGIPINAAEPCIGLQIEDYYNPTGAASYVEWYFQYQDTAAGLFRPISGQINRAVGNYLTDCPIIIKSNNFSVVDMTDVQKISIQSGAVYITGNLFKSVAGTLNGMWFKQLSADGSRYNSLIEYDESNNIAIGDFNGAGQGTHGWTLLFASASTTTPRLAFGTATAATHPALRRNGTMLEMRLGDDSAYASFNALSYRINGGAGSAGSADKIQKTVTTIADATPTTVLTITIPNAAHSAEIAVTVNGSLGAGGAIGANEASATNSYRVVVTRTAGVNAVATVSSAYGAAAAAVAGAATVTATVGAGAVSGAVGATNTIALQVTITKSGGSSANHTCQVLAEVLNANATGVTVA